MALLKRLLAHPLTRGLDIDDPRTTELRLRIVRSNAFLRRIYEQWYGFIAGALPQIEGAVVELGSGAGFLDEFVPGLITSEIFHTPGVRLVMNALQMPFDDRSLRAIVMTDVMHHIPDARRFLDEAVRCLRPGGRVVMIEPWVTTWSRLVYSRLHHEPLDVRTSQWGFPSSGPLSGANTALPWILFERDRASFERDYPTLTITHLRPTLPLRYLLSGGVSLRPLMPGWSFGMWGLAERLLNPWMHRWGMFAQIVLERSIIREPA